MRAILRRTRYGYLLAFHILLLCAVGRNPTEIAAFLFCSRSSVYRIVRAYRAGSLGIRLDPDGQLSIAVQSTILMPWLTRSLGAILKKAPRASPFNIVIAGRAARTSTHDRRFRIRCLEAVLWCDHIEIGRGNVSTHVERAGLPGSGPAPDWQSRALLGALANGQKTGLTVDV